MKKKLLIVLIILVSLFSMNVDAKKLPGFYANEDVEIEKKLDSSLFVAGKEIEVKSEVDGSSFIAGQEIELSSSQDEIFAAGQKINIKNAKAKDAFVAGQNIKIESSEIRDLFVVGSTVTINSEIARNVYIGADKIKINSVINGDVYLSADKIEIGKNAEIRGTLTYPKKSKTKISKAAIIENKKQYKTYSTSKKREIQSKIIDTITSLLSILLIAILLLWLYSKFYTNIEKLEFDTETIVKSVATGLLILIIVPIISILLLISTIGLPLSLIILVIYAIMIYVSIIPSSYYVGNKLLKDRINNRYLLLTVSLTVLYLLRLIPIVGEIVSVISLILGLGITTSIIISKLTIGKTNTKKNK